MTNKQPKVIKLEDLNPLNDLRNKFTINTPYSKINLTIMEPTVKNRVYMLNEIADILRANTNDINSLNIFIKKLIEMASIFIKMDEENEKANINNLEITEVLNLAYLYFELLANNWLLKVTTKCNNCNFENKDTYLYKEEDPNNLKKLHNISGLHKFYELKYEFSDNYQEQDIEINIDKSRKIYIKLGYPSIKTILNNKTNDIIPESLQYIRELKVYKDKVVVYDYNDNLSIHVLLDLPENIISLINQNIEKINYKPIKVYYEYICPNCGHKENIEFKTVDYFLYYLGLLENLTLEYSI